MHRKLLRSAVRPLVTFVGRCRPRPQIDFDGGDVLSDLFEQDVPWPGVAYLYVPHLTAGLLAQSSGRMLVCKSGENVLELSPGSYPLRFVDLQIHNTVLPCIRECTVDGWRVRLRLEVVWRVGVPEVIVAADHPAAILLAAFGAAVTEYVRSVPYQHLAPIDGQAPQPSCTFTSAVQHQLSKRPAGAGFEIVDIIVREISGDPHLIDAQYAVKRDQLALDAAHRLISARERAALESGRVAGAEQSAANIARLEEVRASVAHASLQRAAQREDLELQDNLAQRRHEREVELEGLKGRLQAVAHLTTALAQTQGQVGFQGGMGSETATWLSQSLQGLMQGISGDKPAGSANAPAPLSLRQRILAELDEVLKLPDVTSCKLVNGEENEVRLVVQYPDHLVIVSCDDKYPVEQPRSVMVRAADRTPTLHALEWKAGYSMRDVVQYARNQELIGRSHAGERTARADEKPLAN